MKQPPLFVTGVPRSGTTLLSVLLDNHPAVYIGGDSVGMSLAREWTFLRDQWSSGNTGSIMQLWEKRCRQSYKGRLHQLMDFSASEAPTELRSFIGYSIERAAAREGATIWGDKTPELILHLSDILEIFPEARFIHIVRDPRPNVRSLVRRQYYPLALAGQYWNEINRQALFYRELLGSDQFRIVQYENLLQSSEEVGRELCAFLGIAFEPRMLDLARSEATHSENAYVDAGIDAGRVHQWRNKMEAGDIRRIEAITGTLMQDFGYHPENQTVADRARPLSGARIFWLRQWMITRMLFRARRVQMINRKLRTSRIPLGRRFRNFIFATIRQFLSEEFIRSFRRS